MEKKTRNIVIGMIAHVDAGKTTLSEGLLLTAGTIKKAGRVDNGDAFLDNNALERERGITIFSKQAVFDYRDTHFTLIDTPGHAELSSEMKRALSVLDYAMLIISASEPVDMHTLSLFKLLRSQNIPVFIFINKTDAPETNYEYTLSDLKSRTDDNFVDFENDDKDVFCEDIALGSEELLNEYTENGDILKKHIADAISMSQVIPVFHGSALKLKGIDKLLDALYEYTVMPKYEMHSDDDNASGLVVKEGGLAFIPYKVTHDASSRRMTHIKILSGVLHNRDTIRGQRVTEIRIYSGEKFTSVGQAYPGQVVQILGPDEKAFEDAEESGLSEDGSAAAPGDSGSSGAESHNAPDKGDRLSPLNRLGSDGVMRYDIVLPSGKTVNEVLPYFKILYEEDPDLGLSIDKKSKRMSVLITGKIQMEVLKSIVKRRFDLDISFSEGRVTYLETILTAVDCAGHFEPLRHYAEVHLRLEPLPRGSGLLYADECPPDMLSQNYRNEVMRVLKTTRFRGVLTGSPVTDIRFVLTGGRSHVKHTEGGDFRQAAVRAVRAGLMKAGTVILEPYYSFSVTVPSDLIGKVMTDMQQRGALLSTAIESASDNRGISSESHSTGVVKSSQTDVSESLSRISGIAPVREFSDYPVAFAEVSSGKGTFSSDAIVYRSIAEAYGGDGRNSIGAEKLEERILNIIEEADYDPDLDMRQPSGSIFTSHGSGTLFPWDVSYGMMHVSINTVGDPDQEREDDPFSEKNLRRIRREIKHTEATEEELEKIFEDTYGSRGANARFSQEKSFENRKKLEAPGGNSYDDPDDYEKIRKKHRVSDERIMLVDGYNVVFAWEKLQALAKDNINSARDALMDICSNYAAYEGIDLILVFDAYNVHGNIGHMQRFHNIDVVYTKEAQTADSYIAQTTFKIGEKKNVTVVTSDALVQLIILSNGCRLMSSREFEEDCRRVDEEIRGKI
jgi:ribosomal protection tetracycline resistance protein